MRRLSAAGVLAAVAVLLSGWWVAARADTVSGSIDQPASDGATIAAQPATFSGHFSASSSGGTSAAIHDVQLTITSADGHPGASIDIPNTSGPNGGEGPTQSFTWAPSPGLEYNGQYRITATATYHDVPPDSFGNQAATATRTFYMSVPPATPSGLTAQLDSSARTVKLAWSANPEPDINGYQIQRRDPSSTTYSDLASVPSTTSYTDTSTPQAPKGQYSYRLIALRKSGDGVCCLESNASPAATVTVSSDPVTTTAAPSSTSAGAPGSGAGASSGGSTSGGSTSGTAPGGKLAPPPPLPPASRADAGDFSKLLAQARASTVTTEAAEPDTGFNPRLPFAPRTSRELVNVPGAGQLGGGATLGGDGGERRRLTYEYLAGALVLFVLAMQGLYLKRQVDQVINLEAVEPAPLDPPPTDMAAERLVRSRRLPEAI